MMHVTKSFAASVEKRNFEKLNSMAYKSKETKSYICIKNFKISFHFSFASIFFVYKVYVIK